MTSQAGVSFDVTVADHDELRSALNRLAWAVDNLDPALDEIGASQVTETQWRFERHEAPDGRPWKTLAESTLKTHPSGQSAQILRRSAGLYDSITHTVQHNEGVRVGTNKVYARIHQLGGDTGRGHKTHIEARPYLGLSDAGRQEVLAIISDHLEGRR